MPETTQKKSLQEGTRVLWRLKTEILPAACLHPYLHALRGRLKVKWKTDLSKLELRIDPSGSDVQSLCLRDCFGPGPGI